MALEPNEQMLEEANAESLVMPDLPANYIIEEDVIEDNRLGQLLLRSRQISHEQLQACLDEQLRAFEPRHLGDMLVEQGLVTAEDIQHALKLQLAELQLGQILLRTGSITQAQLDIALVEQENGGELLGSLLIGFGFCSPEEITWALDQQARENADA